MENSEEMKLIMGIGPALELADGISKTLRVGTIKQLEDVGELYRGGLSHIKYAVYKQEDEHIERWIEILNIIFVEGFTREEFYNSYPELMEKAVERFLLM